MSTRRRRGAWPHETYPSNEPITKNELRKLIEEEEPQQTAITGDKPKFAEFDRAKSLEKQGKLEEAAEAYFDAYRLAPGQLTYEQFLAIKKAKRTREFVEVFTVDRLKQVTEIAQPAARIVRDLLKDEATCLDGNVFLKNMWRARPQETWSLLSWRTDEVWDNVTDTVFLIRDRVLPTDIKNEGAGWKRFTIDRIGDKEGTGSGLPADLEPLFRDNPQQKDSLRKLAREVEARVAQYPQWKAGVALLGFLEAELGNEQRAVELVEQVLAETENAIPPKSAWVFGLALEGKNAALDSLVMRLYEKNIAANRDPAYPIRISSLQNLAGLYAKYGRREEARRLLMRLTKPEGIHSGKVSEWVMCPDARGPRGTDPVNPIKKNDQRCMECHRKERNLYNYTVMSNKLADIGYPVHAYLSLARIDNSFYNAYGSDEAWAKANTTATDLEYAGRETFKPILRKAKQALTAQAVVAALESGAFIDIDSTNPVIAKKAASIDLMVSVRGENGKSTLFSPVVDMLQLVAKSKGDKEAIAKLQIDQLLSEAFDKDSDNLDAGIAATVFAFLRGDGKAAEKRTQKLNELVAGKDPQASDVALWLVARLALANERTRDIGRKLADRAVAAARNQNDKLWQEAVTRERSTFAAIQPVPSSIQGFLKAKEAYVRAKQLEQSGDIEKAAEAYLEAYRGDPTLLAYEQFATIRNAKRVREFVEVINADRLLLVPLTGNPVERIVRDLVEDKATRFDGRALLDQMWEARPDDQWPLLGNPPKDTVFRIREPLLEIREQPFKNEKRPPTDPDWRRFRANNTYEAIGRNKGLLQKIAPQLKDTVEQKIHLAKTIREVEQRIEQDPQWKAGLAVLAYLEAELGNEQRAIELIETVLADTENPITCGAAMTFGQAMEGKTAALDKLVIRLYEKSVAEWGEFELGEPEYSLNLSPIQNLAALYAKYDRREEARRLLLRLTIPEGVGVGGSKNKFVTCPPGRVLLEYSGPKNLYPKVRTEDQVPDVNCMACHRKERNLFSYLTMSDKLTDLGYPVDARLSLARIDASFGNSYSSDDDWRQAKTSKLNCTSEFQPVSEKIDRAITPQAVLEALEAGAYNDIDLTKPVIAKNATSIDLMLSVRGEFGKSTLFSPVVDLLELAAKSDGDEVAVAIVQIDQLLAEEFQKHPANVEAGIAATVFAFLRGDFEAAQTRSHELNERVAATEPGQSDIALWLVARLALDNENTEAIGEALTKRVLAAAEKSADALFKEAIVREREAIAKIVALRRLSAAKDAPATEQKDLIDTAAADDVFNTLIAAVDAAGLTETLSESGPFTILAPTDDAFAKLPGQALKDLLKPQNKDKLIRILKYHVIPGRIPSSDVLQAESLVTLIGEPVYAAKQKGQLTANRANVIAADLAASNGFIHVIDEVLIPRGRTLLSQHPSVVEYDWAGNKTWEVKLELPHEFWGLPTGERVVEHIPVDTGNTKDDFGTLHELIVYAAGDGPPRKRWSIPSSLLGARPLPNGQILVWTDEFVRRYDRTGSKLWETEIVWKGQKRLPLGAESLPNGNLRVLFRTSKETYKTRTDTAVEINEQGRVVRELPFDPNIKLLQRLPNGNSLVRVGEDSKRSLIEERDATDKVIWSNVNDKLVITAQRLPNGDTLIGATGEAKAIDMNGNVTWQPDKSQFKYKTAGYESYRYYPVLVPENRSSNERDHRNSVLNKAAATTL